MSVHSGLSPICRGLGGLENLQTVFLAAKSTRRQRGGSTPRAAAQGPRLDKGEVWPDV